MTESPPSTAPGHRVWLRPLLLVVGLGILIALATFFDLGQRLGDLRDWIDSLGSWGAVVYAGLYVFAVVAAIPGSAITGLAGVLFGSVLGTIIVSLGATTGATLAFLIARYIARDSIRQWLSRSERFAKLDALTEQKGAFIVAVTRLVPLFPFNLLNYGFGLTRVPLWTFVFWSWLCMLPGTVAYVVVGDTLFTAVAEGKIPWTLVIIVVVAFGLTLILARVLRRYLTPQENDPDGPASNHTP